MDFRVNAALGPSDRMLCLAAARIGTVLVNLDESCVDGTEAAARVLCQHTQDGTPYPKCAHRRQRV